MASSIKESKRFVCVSSENNNNKFWSYTIYEDGSLTTEWGRVGKSSDSLTKLKDQWTRSKDIDAKVREKTKPGRKDGEYREIQILTSGPTGPSAPASQSIILSAATDQLAKNDPVLTTLVQRLVAANKHELHQASGGQMDIDLSTGIISTPLGVVTKSNIAEARNRLDILVNHVVSQTFDDKVFMKTLDDYLMLVPQKVGHSRGWHHHFIPDVAAVQKQNQLLDQLESSADLAEARLKAGTKVAVAQAPSLFDAEITICNDPATHDRILKMFNSTINSNHEARHLKPIKIYTVAIPGMNRAFDGDGAKIGNIKQLWHGTRIFNVLSILKSGLFLPGATKTMAITGAMFGNGCYFSDQSTKSLNYSYGYWGGGGTRDSNCFMFLADVAMGKEYTPHSSSERLPKAGYDSTFADRRSGVMNNEMIVYRTSQCALRYLVEFDKK